MVYRGINFIVSHFNHSIYIQYSLIHSLIHPSFLSIIHPSSHSSPFRHSYTYSSSFIHLSFTSYTYSSSFIHSSFTLHTYLSSFIHSSFTLHTYLSSFIHSSFISYTYLSSFIHSSFTLHTYLSSFKHSPLLYILTYHHLNIHLYFTYLFIIIYTFILYFTYLFIIIYTFILYFTCLFIVIYTFILYFTYLFIILYTFILYFTTTNTEERSVHTNSESCNVRLYRKIINLISNKSFRYYNLRIFFDAFIYS